MVIIHQSLSERYKKVDRLQVLLEKYETSDDTRFITHQWLRSSVPKRLIYEIIYGDFLTHLDNKSILDVGGGYNSLTKILAMRHDYTLLDIMAHDRDKTHLLGDWWVDSNWDEFEPSSHYDVIIANDLFPNVDQRLDMFLSKYIHTCKQMILSLTYYNQPKYYKVKRFDGDEIYHMTAWNGEQTKSVLEKYTKEDLTLLLSTHPSAFPNERQVVVVRI